MPDTVIKIEGLSKKYRLGLVGSDTLKDDLKGWWYKLRGKEDPTLMIGEENRLDIQSGNYVWALRNINLDVNQGEVLGIIGKNGAGKSTLLKILSRVTGPSEGVIKTRGRIASLLEVGTGMHPELTGRENVFLNGAILGMTKAEIKSRFDEIVDFAGVSRYIDTPVKRYSSGMHVRLGFAVAAFLEPEILIVDEVLAVGDASFQRKAIGKMQDVSKGGGRTVLFVSHNMSSVQKLCSRSVLLENGGIAATGDTNEIISLYLKDQDASLSGGAISSSRTWDENSAPGNELSTLHDIRCTDVTGNTKDMFLSSEEIHITATIDVKEEIDGMRAVVELKTRSGETVFASTNQSVTDYRTAPGQHRITAVIPSNLLNEMDYLVMFNTGIPGKQILVPPGEYLGFSIKQMGSHGSKSEKVWPGYVAPELKWIHRRTK